jgi:hypothetical protein
MTPMKIFTTITPAFKDACHEWLVASLHEVEPQAHLTIECFGAIRGTSDFQSFPFKLHNHQKNRKLVEWIRHYDGEVILVTDSDIIYLQPFMDELRMELDDADLAIAMERLHEDYNIGQMVIRCSAKTARFFEEVGRELERGAWDQEAVNRLLPISELTVRMLSERFANTAVWESLPANERMRILSFHATGTDPRDGKSSMELKKERFKQVLTEWRSLRQQAALIP